MEVVSLTFRQLYPGEKPPRYPFSWKLGEPNRKPNTSALPKKNYGVSNCKCLELG